MFSVPKIEKKSINKVSSFFQLNITTANIKKAAKKYLTTMHYVLGVLKPEK